MTLYDALKASKGLPVSDSYAALWGKSAAESGIKTLTGRLPLFFSTSESKLRDWVIYGNNEPGKNLLDLGEYDNTAYGLRAFAEDGQLRIVGKYNGTEAHTPFRFYTYLEAGDYILSGSPNYSNTGYAIQAGTVIDSSGAGFVVIGYDRGDGLSFTLESASWVATRVYTGASVYDIDVDFTMPIMIRKADTSEAFEPYQLGVGEKTKNLLKITGEDELLTRGITFTHDMSDHTIRVNGQATGNAFYACGDVTLKAGVQYVLSGCPAGGSASGTYTYQLYIAGHSDWGGDTGSGLTLPIMTEDTVVTPRIGVYTGAGELTDLVFKPMIREADTTADFIPYGYQIPLDVRDDMTGEYIYAHDIFIGESPLTEGKSISKSSTGIDIQTIADQDNYPNILTTALTNKPVMMIKYKE